MRTDLGLLQRHDWHPKELEAAFFQRRVDAGGPLHLAPAAHQLDVVLGETVDAIAPELLGGGAGAVGSRDDRGDIFIVGRDRYHADAGTEAEHTLFPAE